MSSNGPFATSKIAALWINTTWQHDDNDDDDDGDGDDDDDDDDELARGWRPQCGGK